MDEEKVCPVKSDRYNLYRERLLQSGFSEAQRRPGHFFQRSANQTAFVVNLYDEECGVTVLYGFASVAQMAGDEDWFSSFGWDDTECHLRNILFIHDENSELLADEKIGGFYAQYKDCSKDEILRLKKERQKLFLDHFKLALKPLGFKKKNTRWTKDLGNGRALSFEAQKSAWSDQYYFNVIVHKSSDLYARESFRRVVMSGRDLYNWQLMTEQQIQDLIQFTLQNYILVKVSRQ
ncbi:MAG: DUF4304 domain-containing protein [Oscillospiraceae bacterium]|nr:DUF4304 domain-containing protein [Oscillospiraceae bacterium]